MRRQSSAFVGFFYQNNLVNWLAQSKAHARFRSQGQGEICSASRVGRRSRRVLTAGGDVRGLVFAAGLQHHHNHQIGTCEEPLPGLFAGRRSLAQKAQMLAPGEIA
jgi:hypothetical protein